jgi:hypothetical protein
LAHFGGQPGIELSAADHAQGVSARQRQAEAPTGKVKMRLTGINVRDFGNIKPQSLKQDFGVNGQRASAELVARVVSLLEDQYARLEFGRKVRKMKRC